MEELKTKLDNIEKEKTLLPETSAAPIGLASSLQTERQLGSKPNPVNDQSTSAQIASTSANNEVVNERR